MPLDSSTITWDAPDPSTITWDAPASVAATPQGRNYALSEVPGAMLSNVKESGGKFLGGLYDAVSHPVRTAGGLLDLAAGGLQNVATAALPKPVMDFLNAFNPDAVARAVQAANAVGGDYAQAYGGYENIKRTLAEDPLRAVSDLSMLLGSTASLAKGAAIVPGLGGIAPRTTNALATMAKYTNPMTALARPLEVPVGVTVAALDKLNDIRKGVFQPKNAMYLRAVEGEGGAVLNAMRNPELFTPGYIPTVAEATASTGVTGIQALAKSAKNVLPTEFARRAEANKSAILDYGGQVAKTPEELAAALETRTANAKQNYGLVQDQLVTADPTLKTLLSSDSVQKAFGRAANIASDYRKPFQIGKNTADEIVPSKILNEAGEPAAQTFVEGESAKYPVQSLHFVKMALDDMVKNPESFGIAAAEVGGVKAVRGELLDWLKTKAPAYDVARKGFAIDSNPINRMEVGQYLMQKLTPALGEETAALKSDAYATGLADAPKTIKNATGTPIFDKLSEFMPPEEIAILNNIRSELARGKQSEILTRAAGDPHTRLLDVAEATSSIAGHTLLPNFLNRSVMLANELWRRLSGKIDKSLAIELATEMLSPGMAAESLTKALRAESRGKAYAAPFKAAGDVGDTLLRFPATPQFNNALASPQQNRNAFNQ